MKESWLVGLAVLLLAGCASLAQPARDYSVEEISTIDTEPRDPGGECYLDYRSQLLELDPRSGDVLWTLDIPFTDRGLYVDDDYLVVAAGLTKEYQPGLIAVDHKGQPTWRSVTPLGSATIFGVVDGDLLVRTYAEDRADLLRIDMRGQLVWETSLERYLFSGPLLVGRTIVTTTQDNSLLTLDTGTGAVVLDRELPYEASGPGAVFGDMAVLAGWEGRMVTVDTAGDLREYVVGGHPYWVHSLIDGIAVYSDEESIVGLALDAGAVVWRDDGDWGDGTAIDRSLVVPGIPRGIRSLDALTGATQWQFFGQSGDMIGAAPANGKVAVTVHLGTETSSSFLVAMIDPESMDRLQWDSPLPGRPTTIEYVGRLVLVGGVSPGDTVDVIDDPEGGWLRAYEPATGALVWERALRDAPAELVDHGGETFLLTADPTVGCE